MRWIGKEMGMRMEMERERLKEMKRGRDIERVRTIEIGRVN